MYLYSMFLKNSPLTIIFAEKSVNNIFLKQKIKVLKTSKCNFQTPSVKKKGIEGHRRYRRYGCLKIVQFWHYSPLFCSNTNEGHFLRETMQRYFLNHKKRNLFRYRYFKFWKNSLFSSNVNTQMTFICLTTE